MVSDSEVPTDPINRLAAMTMRLELSMMYHVRKDAGIKSVRDHGDRYFRDIEATCCAATSLAGWLLWLACTELPICNLSLD